MPRWPVVAVLFGLLPVALTGCFNGLVLKPAYVCGPVEELVMAPSHSCFCMNKVAVIDVDGVILNARTGGLLSSGDNPVSTFKEKLDAAATDSHVKAVVVRINSPGGGVTASDIMYRDLCAFREETGKPVVACMMDVAASGGYYLAMGTDRVFAHPSTVTGSIGVIMSLYNATGLFKLVGVNSDPIKSGTNKDIGNPGRPMTEDERKILQGMVDSFYQQFVEVVARGRAMPIERVKELADGRVYTGVDAQKLGLVDEVGYLEDALKCARSLAHIKDATIVAYDSSCGYKGSIYAKGPQLPGEMRVKLEVPGLPAASSAAGAGFLYLWEPGAVR